MAETFSNSLARAAGIVTSSSSGTIGITTNKINGISTALVEIGNLIDNANFIAGTKVESVGVNSITADRDSTNDAAASSQSVSFLGVTAAIVHPLQLRVF